MFRFDGAKIHFFPDIPAVSAEILALRGWEGEKKRAASVRAVAFGAVLLVVSTAAQAAKIDKLVNG